ncbi:SLIT and NTRK-like protein 4 [Patiria miniata]|uniref:Uncharacterized protein n=1 Tax=Patiria miniata TaxID=46514 RepID=A0A913ZKC9_PATMI|nr:SLIT and NTRK-like protein 4 [Patiria miniata]
MHTNMWYIWTLLICSPSIVYSQTMQPPHECSAVCEYTHWALDADCKNRNLTSIPGQCSQVVTFDLRHNHIRILPVGAFEEFVNLRYLDIEMMELETITPGAFQDNINLVHIYIQINQLTVIRSFTFKGVPNLKQLFLNSNKIKVLDPGAFEGIPKLETLFLSDNDISEISSDLFRNLTKLRYLYLENNHISDIPEGTFTGLTNLRHLSLAGNDLVHIPSGLFDDLKHLRALKLSYNHIISINPLPDLPRLNHIDLFNNQLTSVSNLTDFLKAPRRRRRSNGTKKFTELFLAKNPLNCDCDIEPLRIWLQVHREEIRNHHRANATCASPAELSDVSLCNQQTPFCTLHTSTQLSTDHPDTKALTRAASPLIHISDEAESTLMPITIVVVSISSVVLVTLLILTVYMKCRNGRIPYQKHNTKGSDDDYKQANITENPMNKHAKYSGM